MITTDNIINIINSLEDYKGPKWNLYKVYQYLHDSYVEEVYSPYCKSCDACGHEGCCSPMQCTFGKDCQYKETYLNDLKLSYLNCQDLHNLIYDSGNKELIDKVQNIYDENYDIIYGPFKNMWAKMKMVEIPDMTLK